MTDHRPIPRIADVIASSGSVLTVTWRDGAVDQVDLSGWIATGGDALSPLRKNDAFSRAAVGDHGLAVQWDEDGDVAIDSSHIEALRDQQRPFGRDDLAAWQARLRLSNQEAADFLGVAVSTWHNYKNGETRVPRGLGIACRAVERDPVLFEAHYRPRHPGRPAAE
ncbi:MAG: hypothetical protein H7840_17335 [Alphaproteobacteria bacterium]